MQQGMYQLFFPVIKLKKPSSSVSSEKRDSSKTAILPSISHGTISCRISLLTNNLHAILSVLNKYPEIAKNNGSLMGDVIAK